MNLGVVKENPSTCKGVIEIMKYLHRYTPKDGEGKPWPVICHGDQLSVERMVEGKIAMSSSTLPEDRLEGLIPRPQNFHKRVVLLQVIKLIDEKLSYVKMTQIILSKES